MSTLARSRRAKSTSLEIIELLLKAGAWPNVQLKMLLTRLGWHSTMVVTGDPQQSDLLAMQQFSVSQVCRWIRVPPHKVGILSEAKWANIEHQQIDAAQHVRQYRWLPPLLQFVANRG